METVFSQILNMSLTGSAVILVVILARLLMKRFPKIFSYALWAVVLFRLLCPVSLSGSLSMLDWLRPEVTTVSERTSAVSYLPVRYVYTSEQDNLTQLTPQQEQIAQACAEAEQIQRDMQLGQWQVYGAYVGLNTNSDVTFYDIRVHAAPVLEGGADVKRIQYSIYDQIPEDPAPDNYYPSRAEFRFAPSGELLFLEFQSPMDTTVVSRTNAVYSVADMLKLAE